MSEPARPVPLRDSLLVAGGALLLYLLLAQEALHGLDVHVHVFFLTQGYLEHPFHFLYLKLVGAVWPLLREAGLTPHHALRLISALGSAGFVFCCHRAAARLGLSRGHAALVAGLCAAPAANVFFATVPEIHGLFGAFAGLVWWAWADLVRSPRVRGALVLGVASGVAASVHATGHLLLGAAMLLWWVLTPARTLRNALLLALVAGLAHVALATGLALWLQPGRFAAPFQGQLEFVRDSATDARAFASLWRVLRDEWLLPFLPLSLTCVAALLRPAARALAIATLVGVVVYLALAAARLNDLDERGAYFLPLALPFALCTLRAFGGRTTLVVGLLALGFAVVRVRAHDHVDTAAWVEGFAALARDEPPALICRDVPEQEQITRAVPDAPFLRIDSLLQAVQTGGRTYDDLCRQFDDLVVRYRSGGRTVFLTRGAYEVMAAGGDPFLTRFLGEHLAKKYLLERVTRGEFAAYRVRPR